MEAYRYHPDTGEFIGTVQLEKNPLEPGKYLIPGDTTAVKPISASAGKALVWRGGQWTRVFDYRGTTWFREDDPTPIVITELGIGAIEGLHQTPLEAMGLPGKNKQWIWNDGWETVDDFRGQTWFKGHNEPVVVTELGNPVLLGLSPVNPTAPVVPPTHDEQIENAPLTMFGGPTIGGLFGGN